MKDYANVFILTNFDRTDWQILINCNYQKMIDIILKLLTMIFSYKLPYLHITFCRFLIIICDLQRNDWRKFSAPFLSRRDYSLYLIWVMRLRLALKTAVSGMSGSSMGAVMRRFRSDVIDPHLHLNRCRGSFRLVTVHPDCRYRSERNKYILAPIRCSYYKHNTCIIYKFNGVGTWVGT